MVKYCVLDLLKCAPEFREGAPVVVSLDPAFLNRVKTLMPEAEASAPEKQILKQDVHERALKKHKNFLRRQRAKQAKQQQKKEQQQQTHGRKTQTQKEARQLQSPDIVDLMVIFVWGSSPPSSLFVLPCPPSLSFLSCVPACPSFDCFS